MEEGGAIQEVEQAGNLELNESSLPLERRLTYRIQRTNSLLTKQAMHTLKKAAQISLNEWRIMTFLHERGVSSVTRFSRETGIDKGTASRTVNRMVARGLITVQRDEGDSRRQVLGLSESGLSMAESVDPVMRTRQHRIHAHFSDKELEILFEILERLDREACSSID